jgi:DNA polymerase-3 subunit gamma/tau
MAYTALARTWRPKTFAELVGQEHVRRALVNAIQSGRVHHAFLFTGTRGVGKTTIARIFAKCLNCETGVTAEPCGVCASCREIDSGRFVDLIEVDAASRTKVDDTRELLDNVQYSPTRGRYKVYLIDEVHMLSTHSFNALLKTLEEPPPHVKFLLATTDPQKLPVTVLSRCLQFNLKRLPVAQIADRMRNILEKEGIAFDAAGLRLVAQAADGSLRDGLSLLDQLIAFGNGKAGEEEARAMLGTIARDHVVRLADLLGAMDVPELLKCARSLEEWAPDYAQVLDELASLLVRIAMKQAVSDFEGDELYAPEVLERLAKAIAPEDVQLFYQTAITGRRDLGLAPDPRAGFEMTLLRMIAFRPGAESEEPRRGVASATGAPAGSTGTQGLSGGAAARAAAAAGNARGGGHVAAGRPATRGGSSEVGASGSGGAMGSGSSGAPGSAGTGSAGAGSAGAGSAGAGSAGTGSAGAGSAGAGSAGAGSAGTGSAGAGSAGAGSVGAGSAGAGSAGAGSAGAGSAGAGSVGAGSAGAGSAGAGPARAGSSAGAPRSPGGGASGSAAPSTTASHPATSVGPESWPTIVGQLELGGAARQLATNCVLMGRQGAVLRLALDARNKHMRTPAQEDKLTQALSRYFGQAMRLEFEPAAAGLETPALAEQRASLQDLDAARRAFEADPGVQGLRERFGATLLPDTIRPVK